MKVRKSQLGQLELVAEGAFGRVFKAPQFRLRGEPGEFAYKEFTKDHAEQARSARAVVALWDKLDARERADLARHAAWPRALVHDRVGTVCGLLMPLIPRDFFSEQRDQNGSVTYRPRDLQWMIASEQQIAAAGVDVPTIGLIDRCMVVGKLAYALGRLHRLGWVYGDLSFRNATFALDPPRVMLLDCDGAASLSDTTRAQSNTPFWEPPEDGKQPLQDELTDVYKLGLAILRCLTPGKGAATSRAPSRLAGTFGDAVGGAVLDLVTRALSGDRPQRPPAKQLYAGLVRWIEIKTAPPVIRHAQLLTPVVLRGSDARVEWEVDAKKIVVEAANGQRVEVDPDAHPNAISFRVAASGPVVLEAKNRYGRVRQEIGDVTLYELPRFDVSDVRLPRPAMPTLSPVSLQREAALLGERPVANVGMAAIAVPSPDVVAVIGETKPEVVGLPAFPRLDDSVAEAANVIRTSVMDSGTTLGSAISDAVGHASEQLTKARAR